MHSACSKLLFYCWYRNTEHVYLQEAKLIQRVPVQSELALDDIYIAIDYDISIQFSVAFLRYPV